MPRKRGTASAAFVELVSDAMAGDCLIELEGAGGGGMRIQMKLTASEMTILPRSN